MIAEAALAAPIGGSARSPYGSAATLSDNHSPLGVTTGFGRPEAAAPAMGHVANARSLVRTYLITADADLGGALPSCGGTWGWGRINGS